MSQRGLGSQGNRLRHSCPGLFARDHAGQSRRHGSQVEIVGLGLAKWPARRIDESGNQPFESI
ncbi:hypothetical protein VM1G_11374 [Cytospora mali]|uniref:Uncharacterized protein n=1 Tax=Cytospora mali TaxID=578113 RepID=A0A194VPA2_CYTMA|nr:hypothetical protein VM1G_11374 [Valsa mali]